MKIEFFGSSHGVPSEIRFCNSILVTVGERRFFIDAGAPVTDLMIRRGYPIESIEAVFITHMHGDHTGGIFPLIDISNWFFKNAEFSVYFPDESGVALARQYTMTTDRRPVREGIDLTVYTDGVIYDKDGVRVTSVRVDHAKGTGTFGFIFEAEGKKIYFSGDMSADLHDFPEFLYNEKVDLLVTELAHCSTDNLMAHLKLTKAERVCLNHVAPIRKIDEMLSRKDELDVPLDAAEDGMTYTF